MVSAENVDERYLKVLVDPIRACAKYQPKFGQSKGKGLNLDAFQSLYRADSFYSWYGLDNSLMYAAHKAAGGMTSIYRQIGIGGESLFRLILQDSFGLSAADSTWSYQINGGGGKMRTLALDARIELSAMDDGFKMERVKSWMAMCSNSLDIDQAISQSLKGVVFEVRQGYKSKDAKRQNADITNASVAYSRGYLPCLMVLSRQIDHDVLLRYERAKWVVLTGLVGDFSVTDSTYSFVRDIVGFDLGAFFERNSETLKSEVESVLNSLLSAE